MVLNTRFGLWFHEEEEEEEGGGRSGLLSVFLMDCLLAQGLWSPLFVNMCSGNKTPKKGKKSNLCLLGFNSESDPYCVLFIIRERYSFPKSCEEDSTAFVWQMRKFRRLRVTQSQN